MKTAALEAKNTHFASRRIASDFAELVKQNGPSITSRFFTLSLELRRLRREQPRSTNGGSAGSMR